VPSIGLPAQMRGVPWLRKRASGPRGRQPARALAQVKLPCPSVDEEGETHRGRGRTIEATLVGINGGASHRMETLQPRTCRTELPASGIHAPCATKGRTCKRQHRTFLRKAGRQRMLRPSSQAAPEATAPGKAAAGSACGRVAVTAHAG